VNAPMAPLERSAWMTPKELHHIATRYRAMATKTTDERAVEALFRLAAQYDAAATEMEDAHSTPGQPEGC
jgi:hypothetical protein